MIRNEHRPRTSRPAILGPHLRRVVATVALTVLAAGLPPAAVAAGFTLTVSKAGDGQGTVTSVPAGIDCASDCTEDYPQATQVTLTATADPGSEFAGFSGACTGTGPCVVTVDQARTVTASFRRTLRTLTVTKEGEFGTVTSSPAGIDCGTDCTQDYADGTVVTLTASPAPGSNFGDYLANPPSPYCATVQTTCTLRLNQSTTVRARFNQTPTTVAVLKEGDGKGTVTSSPPGIQCGPDCDGAYSPGTTVTLTAVASPGSTFTGYVHGTCYGNGATCTLPATGQPEGIVARFELTRRTLRVAKTGDGQGTVTSSPPGIRCGADCSQDYLDGTAVTLTAAADAGSTFNGFSGAGCGGETCTVAVEQARTVTATFTNSTAGTSDTPPGPATAAGPGPGSGPAPEPPLLSLRRGGGKATAKLEVARSRLLRATRRLEVLAPISRLASGRVRVELAGAGRRYRFTAPIDTTRGRIRFTHPIPAGQAALGTAILTISYPGDADTRAQQVRLRAASRPAALKLKAPKIINGRLQASGTISRAARGVVRVEIEYVIDDKTVILQLSAPIRNGTWKLDEALSPAVRDQIARRQGAVQSYTQYTGSQRARIRGEISSHQVLPDP